MAADINGSSSPDTTLSITYENKLIQGEQVAMGLVAPPAMGDAAKHGGPGRS